MHQEGGAAPTISFVVPVLDELDGLDALRRAITTHAEAHARTGAIGGWEAVVVDDGSTDGSGPALDEICRQDPRWRVVHHAGNRGLGRALRTAVAASTGEVVVYTDADLPFDLSLLDQLVRPITDGEADIVSGRRLGRSREGQRRALQSVVYNALVRATFALPISDVNFACKVFRREAFPTDLVSDTGFIDAEWLIRAHRDGARILQVPVEFLPRTVGTSTAGGADQVRPVLGELLRFRREAAGPARRRRRRGPRG